MFRRTVGAWQGCRGSIGATVAGTNFGCIRFAGHSKWQNIRHDKAKNDAKKSRDASILAGRIETSVRIGGSDANAQLETLVEKAKKLNIGKKIIENAIKRGLGEIDHDGPVKLEVLYEFIGPGGVAFIIVANTDNKARTVASVKLAMSRFNASLSPCSYLFNRKGEIIFQPLNHLDTLDDILEVAIDLGADDVEIFQDPDEEYDETNLYRLITEPNDVHGIANELSKLGFRLKDVKTSFIPDPINEVEFPEDSSKGFKKCLEELDSIPEIVEYYSNIKD
jgi:YebC/PmpR family DNA-binding regulatory protein